MHASGSAEVPLAAARHRRSSGRAINYEGEPGGGRGPGGPGDTFFPPASSYHYSPWQLVEARFAVILLSFSGSRSPYGMHAYANSCPDDDQLLELDWLCSRCGEPRAKGGIPGWGAIRHPPLFSIYSTRWCTELPMACAQGRLGWGGEDINPKAH